MAWFAEKTMGARKGRIKGKEVEKYIVKR